MCVEKCPDKSFSGYALANTGQNTKALRMMKPYCDPFVSGASDFDRKDAVKLIKDGICPAWVLASNPVLGRCMPAADPLNDNSRSNNPRGVTSSKFKTASTFFMSYFQSKNKEIEGN